MSSRGVAERPAVSSQRHRRSRHPSSASQFRGVIPTRQASPFRAVIPRRSRVSSRGVAEGPAVSSRRHRRSRRPAAKPSPFRGVIPRRSRGVIPRRSREICTRMGAILSGVIPAAPPSQVSPPRQIPIRSVIPRRSRGTCSFFAAPPSFTPSEQRVPLSRRHPAAASPSEVSSRGVAEGPAVSSQPHRRSRHPSSASHFRGVIPTRAPHSEVSSRGVAEGPAVSSRRHRHSRHPAAKPSPSRSVIPRRSRGTCSFFAPPPSFTSSRGQSIPIPRCHPEPTAGEGSAVVLADG